MLYYHTVLGVVGEMEENPLEESKQDYYLFTHKKFDIGFNGNQVCVNVIYPYLMKLDGSTIFNTISISMHSYTNDLLSSS